MSAESGMNLLNAARSDFMKPTPARERLGILFDEGSFVELDAFAKVDGKPAGVVTGYGTVFGTPCYAFAQDPKVFGGAVGRVHAAKIKKVYDLAIKTGAPVVGIYDSNGARLAEGNDALAAYGEMLSYVNNLSGVVPQVSVVVGTCAGTAAMIACSADFVVMSEDAQFFMTAPFVAKAKGEKVEGAGTAKNAALSGVAQIVEKTKEDAVKSARNLVAMLPMNNLAASPVCEFAGADAVQVVEGDIAATLRTVADQDSLMELYKEFGTNVYAALATMGGYTCAMLATKNSAKLTSDDCSKIARIVSFCDAFQLPVITFVDTEGFVASSEAELAGSIREAAKLAHVYAEATCPKVSVVTGKAYGSAFIALAGKNAGADLTVAWPDAVISALEPQTAVAILMGDKITAKKGRAAVEQEYMETSANAFAAAADGSIEDVIDPADTRKVILSALEMLESKRVAKLPKKHSIIPF
ncbi:carboxyl transferase domain-containing protein [Candidatus Soleaferrea massiliensis]|uniref:carboxyl transferase domain-containing protein n=1 Tax=Candidatus Soleaferrea massiliensis TaxID=1470354 RepID=UPI0009E27231|nr:carboxyl transferase domain-containing protein [Candidatus Soleaferrea massiliensis]